MIRTLPWLLICVLLMSACTFPALPTSVPSPIASPAPPATAVPPSSPTSDVDALLDALYEQGIALAVQPLIQRETMFDRLAGETITQRVLLASDAGITLDYYRFPDAATADAMAASIQPGGTELRTTRADGQSARERVEEWRFLQPIAWWRAGDGLLRYLGKDATVIQAVTDAVGGKARLDAVDPTEVEWRVVNLTGEPLSNVTLRGDEMELPLGEIEAYDLTPFVPILGYPEIFVEDDERSVALDPTMVAGDVMLEPGRYTFLIGRVGGDLRLAMFQESWALDPIPLLVGRWRWVEVELADGSRRAPQFHEVPPAITFTDQPYSGETTGLGYTVQYGCNSGEGSYLVAAAGTLVTLNGARTMMDCEEAIMQDEGLLASALSGGFLLMGGEGDRLTLTAGDAILTLQREPEVGSTP